MADHDNTATPADPSAEGDLTDTTDATMTDPDPDATSGGKTPLIITIVALVGILVVVAILAALGVFAPADEEPVAEPTETPEITEEPAPEPELAGFVTPETWCTAVRNVALDDFADSPSFVWWATVLTTDDGALVAEGTEFELIVPGADVEPIEAVVGEFGILEALVPISSVGLFELLEIIEAGDGREVPGGPFTEFEVAEGTEFGPECEGPEESALDDLILESELFG